MIIHDVNRDEIVKAINQSAIVSMTDVRGVITHVNDGFCKISGYSREELLGSTHRIVNSGTHSKEFFAELWQTIAAGGVWSGVIRNRSKDGREYRVHSVISPLRGPTGVVESYLSIRFDVTRLEEAELMLAEDEARLASAAKLASLGEMAASVVHEISNTLAIIHGQASLSQAKFRDVPGAAAAFAKIEATTLRAANIVKGISTFARGGQDIPSGECNVSSLLASVKDLCNERVTKAAIEFRVKLGSPTTAVFGNTVQLSQVLVNLINNSVDAIASRPQTGARDWIEMSATCADTVTEIRVSDSGPGVPAAIRSRLMTSFVTTKAPGKGTGLGLSISRGIVAAHGGRFFLDDSAPFTTFVVALPTMVLAKASVTVSKRPVELASPYGDRKILILDDEPAMAELMADEIRGLGMQAVEAGTVTEAKEKILLGGVDLVLTDYRLVGENGLDLVRWINQQNGGKPASIVISGGFGTDFDAVKHAPGVVGILHKPISMMELKVALHQALERGPESRLKTS